MLKNSNKIFQYNGSTVTFQKKNSQVMINLTDVAKAFPDKNLTQIINSQEIKEYCNALSELQNYSSADNQLIRVVRGGNPKMQGTWANQKVALRVAQKLSPHFAVWVDNRLEELLTTGVTTVNNEDEVIAQAMNVLQKRLEANKQRLQIAQAETEYYKEEVKELTPKAKYTDEVLQSTSTFTLTQIAHDLGLRSVHVFTKTLKEKRILHKQSGQWQPTSKFADKGYFDTRTAKYVKSDETIGTSISTVITEKGRQYFHNLFTNQN